MFLSTLDPFSQDLRSADEVVSFYTQRRTGDLQEALITPSQFKYVQYWEYYLSSYPDLQHNVLLQHIIIQNPPMVNISRRSLL